VTGLRLERLSLSAWPFVIIAPGEVLGAMLVRRTNPTERLGLLGLLDSVAAVLAGVALAAAGIWIARRLIERSRSLWWRGVPAAVMIYVVLAVMSGLLMVVILIDRGPGGQPVVLTVLYMVTRPVNIMILAVVVQLVRDGLATTRTVDAITQDQLLLARQTNQMIEAAEEGLRAESLRTFAGQVAEPLRAIVRDGSALSDDELADRIDEFIEVRLRPLAHVLHPVSVRLGLIAAMRSLNPDITVDSSATVERMDADGVLLEEEVRVQIYRWIRAGLPAGGASRAALVVRGRELHVSLHPAIPNPVDAVQAAAGLRLLAPGVVSVPLRGQSRDVGSVPAPSAAVPIRTSGYRLRDLMTVPIPMRLVLVTVLSIGSAPLQFVVYRWSPSPGTLLASLACALAPIAMVLLLDRLPPAAPSLAGAWRVLAEWLAIAAASGIGFAAVGTAYGVLPQRPAEWALILLRMSYRYAIPGLMVTVSYGLVARSRARLAGAQEALQVEERRRIAILSEARQLDRDVAEALHRTVQGRLAAAVIMLRLGQRDEAWAQVIEMASVEVPWLLERMGETPSGALLVPDPPLGLSVVQVDDVPVDAATFALLRRAVGEVALNARRHGRASALVIAVESRQGRCRVVCEDDGAGLSPSAVPGLGSRLLDDTAATCGGTWWREPMDSGCRVVIEVPAVAMEPVRASSSA
jgi:two-component sensor histidine kinase/multisubunit Na+/H+ antiporter MnhE subunit